MVEMPTTVWFTAVGAPQRARVRVVLQGADADAIMRRWAWIVDQVRLIDPTVASVCDPIVVAHEPGHV